MTSHHREFGQPALEMLEAGDVLEAAIGERRAVPALGGGLPADGAVEPVVVVVEREAQEALVGSLGRREPLAVEQLGLDTPQKRSILPLVQGEFTWVRMCLMRSSLSVLPKSVRTPGIQVAKGLPLSLMTSSGMPTSSKQSPSQVRMGSVLGRGSTRRPMRKREWSSTRPTIQTFVCTPGARFR